MKKAYEKPVLAMEGSIADVTMSPGSVHAP